MKTAVVIDGVLEECVVTLQSTDIEVYEVLRIMKGVPLFWEAHFERFLHSVQYYRNTLIVDENDYLHDLNKLMSETGVTDCNVRFSVVLEPTSRQPRRRTLQFFEALYPTTEMYKSGVDIGIYSAERPDPSVKVLMPELRKTTTRLMVENNWYEVLLIDSNGNITEGSKSNIFFIKDGKIITSEEANVLSGITRQRVIGLIKALNYDFVERLVALDELATMDAIFMTGTSPKILPVRACRGELFDVNDSRLRGLMNAFDEDISIYLKGQFK